MPVPPPTALNAAPPPLRVALIGLQHLHPAGYLTHFQACPLTEVVCVYDPDAARVAAFHAEYGLRGYTDLGRMLQEEALDWAAIFLPHADCAAAAAQCAARGLHLMVEKPMAATVAGAQQIAAAAHAAGVKLTTGYCWRYHPVVRRIKALVAQGALGKLVAVEARLSAGRVDRYLTGHSAWMLEQARAGGGPIYNLGVHWLDLIGHVTGESVRAVCAVNTKSSTAYDVEDSSLALLKLGSGAAGSLTTSYIVPDSFPNGRDLYLALRGTEGMLAYSPQYAGEQATGLAAPTEHLELYGRAAELAGATHNRLSFELEPVAGYSGYMGRAYIEGFAAAIRDNRAPDITAAEALTVLRIVAAVYQSAAQNQWIEVMR